MAEGLELDRHQLKTMLENGEADLSPISVEPPELQHSSTAGSPPSESHQQSTPPLSDAANGRVDIKPAQGQSRFQALKDWSHQQVKCTRQFFNEKLGRSAKTVDSALDARVEALRTNQKKFNHLLFLSKQLATGMQAVADTQRSLSENFAFLSVQTPELGTEFDSSSKIQKVQSKHSDDLVRVLLAFHHKMETLVNKTMEDTFLTVKQYEAARLSYDASRTAVEKARQTPPTTPTEEAKYEAIVAEFEQEKAQYEKIHKDLDIKLQFVNANKVCELLRSCSC